MKRWLILVRHAKSSWKEALPDRQRPLNKRGQRDGPKMAQRLANKLQQEGRRADRLVSSPAERTRCTAEMFAEALSAKSVLGFDERLYAAPAETIMQVARESAETQETVLVVAHNPGLTEAACQLSGEELDNVPTAGVVVLELAPSNWASLGRDSCRMLMFDFPKRMRV